MVLSLLVLLVPIVLLVGGYQMISGRMDPVAIDPGPALVEARASGLAVVEPIGLDPRWVPVSAVFQDGPVLRLGYVTPAGDSAQLVQSPLPPEELYAGLSPSGTVEVAGQAWQRYQTRPGERALVLQVPDLTTIVVGTADEPELHTLAAAAWLGRAGS